MAVMIVIDPTAKIAIAMRGRGERGDAIVDHDHDHVVEVVDTVEVAVLVVERGEEIWIIMKIAIIEMGEKKEKDAQLRMQPLLVPRMTTHDYYSKSSSSNEDDDDNEVIVAVVDRGAGVAVEVDVVIHPPNIEDVVVTPGMIGIRVTIIIVVVIIIIVARRGIEIAAEAIVDAWLIVPVVAIAAVEEGEVMVGVEDALAVKVADLTLKSPRIIGVVGVTVPRDQQLVITMAAGTVLVDNRSCHVDNDPNHVPTNVTVVSISIMMNHRIIALVIETATTMQNVGIL